ncbi:MAG: TonB-dependent receptor [bacterium]|nr:MAG: TonB-dependent receptor [bacterium]
MNTQARILTFLAVGACAYGTGVPAEASRAVFSADTLLFPTEAYVVTAEELDHYNIHTLEDILELLFGVTWWREGPPGSRSGFSIGGRSDTGITLLVNGEPFYDPYTYEPLARFLPLSRVKAVEVLFGGSPFVTGVCSSNGVINCIVDEAGGVGPLSEVEFTYGRNNRRARRVWFSTPGDAISASIAYDEYLQDAFESYPAIWGRRLGDYNSRSVLIDLVIEPDSVQSLCCKIQRYDDMYIGTPLSAIEGIRYDGFDSMIRYRRSGLVLSVGQRNLEQTRRAGRITGFATVGSVRYSGRISGIQLRTYCSGERSVFENRLWGVTFDPSFHRIEGGITVGGFGPAGTTWRAGLCGGGHSEIEGYIGGEAGVSIGRSDGFSQSLAVARRLRLPSAMELFQPELEKTLDGIEFATSGAIDLEPEVMEEVSLGTRLFSILTANFFLRRERFRIELRGYDPAEFRAEGAAEVIGGSGIFTRRGRFLGFDYGINMGLEVFGKRSAYTNGIPEYRVRGGTYLSRRLFKQTETLSIRFDFEAAGDRIWEDMALDPYQVLHLSAGMTIMSARIRFQVRNLLDETYETVPGFSMSGRYFIIGMTWSLFD